MIRATTKNTIAKTLWPLGKDRFEKFCFVLRDRRDDPRVSLAELDDASVETISNLLVSKFSAAKAVEVTIELLRDITCNSEADMLGEFAGFTFFSRGLSLNHSLRLDKKNFHVLVKRKKKVYLDTILQADSCRSGAKQQKQKKTY